MKEKSITLRFSDDRPISCSAEDRQGRRTFASGLVAAIASYRGRESLVIALHGPWGSGSLRSRTSCSNHCAPGIRRAPSVSRNSMHDGSRTAINFVSAPQRLRVSWRTSLGILRVVGTCSQWPRHLESADVDIARGWPQSSPHEDVIQIGRCVGRDRRRDALEQGGCRHPPL